MRSIFVLIAGVLATMSANGQQAFNPVTYSGWASTPTNQFTSIPAAPGATFSQFSRGSGNQFSTAADGINAGKWNNATPAEAITAQRFFTFSVSANSVSNLQVDSLKFIFARNASGPDSCIVQYKNPATSYNFAPVTATGFQIFAPGTSATTTIHVIPATPLAVTPGDSIVFRVVAWGATGTLGTMKIMNGTQVFGSVTAAPSNSIAAPSVLTTEPFCIAGNSSDSIRVAYTAAGTFSAGNIYSLELSDNTGSFTSPVVIGTLNDISNAGEIEGLIPAGTAAGNYRLRISSSNPAISGTDTTEITVNPGFSLSAVLTQPLCASQTGSINLSVSSGTAPFVYNWSNNATSQDVQNLEGGEYTVMVTDAAGCAADSLFEIDAIDSLEIDETITSLTCSNSADGAVSLAVSGGTAPYTYAWGNSTATANERENLAAGSYAVTVTDHNGCTVPGNFTVTAPAALVVNGNVTHALCNDSTSGMIAASVSGGTAPYTYAWGNSTQTTPVLDNLAAGTYNVTVTDHNGCTIGNGFTVNEPASLVVIETIVNASCATCQGTITLNVTGGTAPYSYDWNGTPNTSALSAVPGQYCVEITDNNGCQVDDCYQILSTAGMEEAEGAMSAVTVFPNPSAGAASISFQSEALAGKGKVEITDVQGKLIGEFATEKQEIFLALDVSAWKDGVYFFRVAGKAGRFVLSH